MVKRITITLDDEQYELLKSVKGMSKKDAERVKNILLAYLSEKSYTKDFTESKR